MDEYDERVMIGEIYLPLERLVSYYGTHPDRLGAHLPFNFQLLLLPWKARAIGRAIAEYEGVLPPHGWPNWVLGNHDQPRIATRVGRAQARVAAMLLLTLRGTPTIYYGDEIGMVNVDVPTEMRHDPARFDDPGGGRDPERTPMRWDGSPNGGFSTGAPWLPLGDDVDTVNVAVQREMGDSMLELHRRLIALRRAEPALTVGPWSAIAVDDEVLVYGRALPDRRLVVALNLGDEERSVRLPAAAGSRVLISTLLDRTGEEAGGRIGLRANEGVVLEATP